MSNYYTKNFDTAIYYGFDGGISDDYDWPADAIWKHWLDDKERKLPKYLANSLWFNFTAALDYFISNYQGLGFADSVDDPVLFNNYLANLRKALNESFSTVINIIGYLDNPKKNWFTHSPFVLESKLSNFQTYEYTDKNYITIMSAYSIMQCDEGITGLLENDAVKSASCLLYADQAISCIAEIIMFENEGEVLKKAHSQFSQRNAFKRHAETYELKQQAIDYWRKHIDPKLSNDKAAELLTKVVALSHRKLSQYVAEAKRENIRPAS